MVDAPAMGRMPLVPEALKREPFALTDARRAGLERWHLDGASWKRVAPGIYAWAEIVEPPMQKLEVARLRLPAAAAFSGRTAAWLHGLDVPPCEPIEATVPADVGGCRLVGIAIRRESLGPTDITTVRGMRSSSITRTLADICKRTNLIEAVVLLDMALHARLVRLDQLMSWSTAHAGRAGIKTLRSAIANADAAAESPMESRLRMLLIQNGLPRPQAQVPIHDRSGRFAGRLDLYYEQRRLGIGQDVDAPRQRAQPTGERAALPERPDAARRDDERADVAPRPAAAFPDRVEKLR